MLTYSGAVAAGISCSTGSVSSILQGKMIQGLLANCSSSGSEPSAAVSPYNAAVDAYNAQASALRSLIARYNQLVDDRNSIAAETNQLTAEISNQITSK